MASATLFALFLLSALTFYPPSTTAQPITDMYGNAVRNGGKFHILSFLYSSGGGTVRIKTGNETLPLSVVQSSEDYKGLPVIISSPFSSEFIPEGSRVSISFVDFVTLERSLVWVAVEGQPEGTVVKVDYTNTVSGYFSIHRVSGNRYKLLFCTPDGSLCGNVGIVRDDALNKILVITQDDPYVFVLEELPSASAASK